MVFGATLAWFLLYPWRDLLADISPAFGLQRPVPLFAFTSITILSATLVYWYAATARGWRTLVGAGLALLVVLMAQSRGMYLSTLAVAVAAIALRPAAIQRHARLVAALVAATVTVALVGHYVTGRLGEPVGWSTVLAQLATLLGEQGPGTGSYEDRVETWPIIADQVLESPFGPWVGVGLGRDLFLGFTLAGGVMVRKPHNDFLEIWARFGVAGLLPWLGILATFLYEAARRYRLDPRNLWILALQISLWIVAAGQPAMAFAYVTVVWATLTGLWLGAMQASVRPPPRYLHGRSVIVERSRSHRWGPISGAIQPGGPRPGPRSVALGPG
jgi:O-antigen ligase